MINYYVYESQDDSKINIAKIDIVPMKYKNLNYGIRFSEVFLTYYLFDLETGRYLAKNESKEYLLKNIEILYHKYEKYIGENPEEYKGYIQQLEELKGSLNSLTYGNQSSNGQSDAV